MVIDESHVTIPQIGGMYKGDRSRKENLVDYGFRLPSALDNRPLRFDEFRRMMPQTVFVSATPAEFERVHSGQVVEQVVRPTGLVDPQIEVRPATTQVDNLMSEVRLRTAKGERVLVTTLTKRMAEDLTDYFSDHGIKVRYLIPTSIRWSGWKSSVTCGWENLMCWWASTCCARGWIFRKFRWWPYWMRTRKAFSVRNAH